MNVQKRLAADLMKVSKKKIKFDNTRLDEIKEAITKQDVKALLSDGAIIKQQKKGVSKARARKIGTQKKKGRKRGVGSRKGTAKARLPKKINWMNKIRAQRELLRELRDKKIIAATTFRNLYSKAKGGYFRNKRHIKLYIQENELVLKHGKK